MDLCQSDQRHAIRPSHLGILPVPIEGVDLGLDARKRFKDYVTNRNEVIVLLNGANADHVVHEMLDPVSELGMWFASSWTVSASRNIE